MRTLFFAPNEQASRTVFLVQELMCLLAMLSQNRILNVSQTEKHVPGSTAARRGPAGEREPPSSNAAELASLGQLMTTGGR